jgi:hypothetical protein
MTAQQAPKFLAPNEPGKPDFQNMSAKELVQAHNALTGGNRKAPFDSKADAIRRCEKLWAEQNPVVIQPAATIAEGKDSRFSGKKKSNGVKTGRVTSSKPAVEEKPKTERASFQRVIAIVAGKEPPREGTVTRKYYDLMGGSPTVGQYLDRCDDRKRASLELRNVIRGGRVSLKG